MNAKLVWLGLIALALLADAPVRAADLLLTPDKPAAVYAVGEPIHWKVQWNGSAPPASLTYVLKKNDVTEVAKGTLTLDNNAAEVQGKLDEPGWLMLKVDATSASGGKTEVASGALADPQKLQPTSPRPADFDEFWKAKLQELAAVDPNPKLQSVKVNKPDIDYYKITMDNIRGTHIQGQLARPTKGDKFPAVLILQWAGVYGLDKSWVVDKATEGWLALDINAHDLPIDQPKSFYQQQKALQNYPAIGNDDRDTSYFLRMYLGDYQALEYLKSRPDWNGKTLLVMGTSMGGQQSLMLAGLHPDDITAVTVDVPSGSDMLAPAAGRLASYPEWYWNTAGKDAAKVHEASRYYDVVNFVSRIKCPLLAGIGLIDETSPPTSVMTSMNQITSPKEILLMPGVPHQEMRNAHAHYYERSAAWRAALLRGDPPPVNRE
jgi:cephalosporin-C deacetylase-like acetyl esterase